MTVAVVFAATRTWGFRCASCPYPPVRLPHRSSPPPCRVAWVGSAPTGGHRPPVGWSQGVRDGEHMGDPTAPPWRHPVGVLSGSHVVARRRCGRRRAAGRRVPSGACRPATDRLHDLPPRRCLPMSNKDRIKALEHRVDGQLKYIWELSDRMGDLERLLTPPPPKRSLADEAKARAADLGDRVLRAVGL